MSNLQAAIVSANLVRSLSSHSFDSCRPQALSTIRKTMLPEIIILRLYVGNARSGSAVIFRLYRVQKHTRSLVFYHCSGTVGQFRRNFHLIDHHSNINRSRSSRDHIEDRRRSKESTHPRTAEYNQNKRLELKEKKSQVQAKLEKKRETNRKSYRKGEA